jgi:hypothetical protein
MAHHPPALSSGSVKIFLGKRSHDNGMGSQKNQHRNGNHPKQVPGNTEDNFLAPNITFIADYFSHCTTLFLYYCCFLFCYCDFSFYLRSSLSPAVAPAGSDAGTSGSGLSRSGD